MPPRIHPLLCVLVLLMAITGTLAPTALAQSDDEHPVDPALFEGLTYRMVGPYRGGRSTAVTGIAGAPTTYFMGTTGGGVWKTDDDGLAWNNVSDAYFGGSIGAVDVADAEPSVIYVGMGSACIRGNTSTGRGLWKSNDGGKSWTFMGLREAG